MERLCDRHAAGHASVPVAQLGGGRVVAHLNSRSYRKVGLLAGAGGQQALGDLGMVQNSWCHVPIQRSA